MTVKNQGHWIESNAPYVVLKPVIGVEEHCNFDTANRSRMDFYYRTKVDASILKYDMEGQGTKTGKSIVTDSDGVAVRDPDGGRKTRQLNCYVKVHDGMRHG